MQIAPLVLLGTLVYAFTNFVKYVTSKDWNSVVTQLLVWLFGFAAVSIAAHAQVANAVKFNGVQLGDLSWSSLLLLGLLASSLFTSFYDLKKAIDPTDTAATPGLLTGFRGTAGNGTTAASVAAAPVDLGPVIASPITHGPASIDPPLSVDQARRVAADVVDAAVAHHEETFHKRAGRKAAPPAATVDTAGEAEHTGKPASA